jgi:hypothetical protein
MAMSGDILGDAILAAVDAVPTPPGAVTFRRDLFRALAAAIVAHITTQAVVSTTVAVTNVSAVTPGVGVSGPGAGTGTGTIS